MDGVKSLLGSFCLMLSVLLGLSATIGQERKDDWLMWAIFFLIVAIGFWLWIMREQRSAEEAAEDALDAAETVKRKVEIRATPEPEVKQEATPAPKAEPPAAPMPPAPVPPAPGSVPAIAAEPDDLTRIEGIGPKMADILIAAGVDSYAKLAAMSEEAIEQTVKAGGGRKSASMGTWAEQAKLAAKGDWNGLAKYQTRLKKS